MIHFTLQTPSIPTLEETNGALKMLETGRVGHLDTVVVSICTFHSGTMANIFAETEDEYCKSMYS